MCAFQCWNFPEISHPTAEKLFQGEKKLIVIGLIGKSVNLEADKTIVLGFDQNETDRKKLEPPMEGQIKLLHNPSESLLLVHFETTYDMVCMQKMLRNELVAGTYEQFLPFNQSVRNRFARMLLFATHVCHIIVFVELSVTFDAALLPMFKALRIIRDKHVLKFLPKLLKNSSTGAALGKYGRLCSPRMLFLFENFPNGFGKCSYKSPEAISKLEFEVEDNIYRMLCNDSIVANNSGMSLFSIPSNKRFVYYNTDPLWHDAVQKSVDLMESSLRKHTEEYNCCDSDGSDELLPYKGFGKSLNEWQFTDDSFNFLRDKKKSRKFITLLREHAGEAMKTGFDDNMSKQRGKSHFVVLGAKTWYETFKMLYKVFIENPDNSDFEANDADYKSYLENFDRIMDFDDEFFTACCAIGLQKAFAMYNNPTLTHYSTAVHKRLVDEAIALYLKYARGPQTTENIEKLRELCDTCWLNGKQQCEQLSLRGHSCVLPKLHVAHDIIEHSSAYVYISACNCGHTQGRREDPYTIRAANCDFYDFLANNCNHCVKVQKYIFSVFQPSINDYRAADLEKSSPRLNVSNSNDGASAISAFDIGDESDSQPLTVTQGSPANLSLESIDIMRHKGHDDLSDDEDDNGASDSLNELVLHVRDKESEEESTSQEHSITRQPSTTEYLPGMVHTETPLGLLPLFPSWSLVCVGPGSVYSHNTGLLEHFQSGFLSGSNFLLPWDVHVRLEHSASWVAFEKTRYRKMGEVFVLKIFIGFEYECPRGHRFMMATPDKVLRGSSSILRDSGSKVVFNNMPLYFPCPCRSSKFDVAQLMRVHVVTPKAPVNVILEPKIRTGDSNYLFTLGMPSPPKLTQSAYWILRLPFIYQGDEPIAPPNEITAANALNYGCMMAGMFGVSETELDE